MGASSASETCVNKPTCGLTRPLQSPFLESYILNFDRCRLFADLGKIDKLKQLDYYYYYYYYYHNNRYQEIFHPFKP
jgi:hypothetical protein